MLLYTFSVTSFDWYNEWTICLILFNKLFQLLPAFTYARAIGNLWSICLGVSILSLEWSKFEKTCTYIFYWKYFTFKSIRNSFSTIKKYIKAFKDIFFLLFFSLALVVLLYLENLRFQQINFFDLHQLLLK